jgi:hypothetical protein
VQPILAGERPEMPVPVGDEQVIAIAPSTAPSGTNVAIAGAGWNPNEVVYVNLEGVLDGVNLEATLVMTSTDAEGRFETEFIVPLDIFWEGATDVQVAAYSLDKVRNASTAFTFTTGTVTPTHEVTPTQVVTPAATATPTPIPTQQPTLVPPPTQSPGGENTARVMSAGLNMRMGPGTNYPILRALPYGAVLLVLGQDYTGGWLYVRTMDLQLGWVARAYTSFTGRAPIISAPPTPTAPPTTPTPTPTALPTFVPPPSGSWLGEYYANRSLSGYPVVVRQDAAVDFNWGYGSPAPGIPADNFSVRWNRSLWFDEGTYRFYANADDGVRVWVDGSLVIDQWHTWRPETYSGEIWLGSGYHQVVVDYYEEYGLAFISMWWERVNPNYFPDWKGRYYSNPDLEGDPTYLRNDFKIDFNWGTSSPAPGIGNTNYSVKWTREVDFSSGYYRLNARSDDGIRVYVDGKRVINEWRNQTYGPTYSHEMFLSGDHDLQVEYYQAYGGARVRFWWERIDNPTPTSTPTFTPTPTFTATLTPTFTPTPTGPAPANPYADANPSSGPSGTTVTVSFGNFPANTAVNLYIGGFAGAANLQSTNAQVYASTSSDRFGRGSMTFVMPSSWPDGAPIRPGKLVLLVATPGFGVTAGAEFDLLQPQPTVAPNPYARINPSSGGAGTVVTVQGGGFPANTVLNLFLGGVVTASAANAAPPVASTVSDVNGNFVATFTMPSVWPDGQPITSGKLVVLVATANFGVETSATFDYFTVAANPAVTLSPTAGVAGTIVTVNGSGFPANVNVGIYLAALDASVATGDPIRYAAGRTDANGRATLSITMPSNWPNGAPIAQDKVVVTMARTDFSVSASAVFNYLSPGPTWTPTPLPTATTTPPATATAVPNPSANLTPRSGGAGTVVTITGGGFPGNSTIYAHLAPLGGSGGSGNEYANYAIVATTPTGEYTMIFAMPAVWPNGTPIETGRIAILIATADFSRQTSVSFDYVGVTAAEQPPAVPDNTPEPTATLPPPEPPTVVPADTPAATPVDIPIELPTEAPPETPVVIPGDSDGQSTIPPAPIEPGN